MINRISLLSTDSATGNDNRAQNPKEVIQRIVDVSKWSRYSLKEHENSHCKQLSNLICKG